jgi:phage major head subunit gpT-like protein
MPKTNLTQLEKELKAVFWYQYEQYGQPFSSFVTEMPSESDEELYAFLMSFPEIHEFKDMRQIQRIEDMPWTLRNKKYEGTIAINQDEIDDNKANGHLIEARQLGEAAAGFFDDLIVTLIEANGLCFDGQNFFDTDHKLGVETAWANTRGGTGTSYAQLTTDFDTASSAILARKNPKNKPYFKQKPNWLILSPAPLYNKFEDLRVQTEIGGAANTMKGKFDHIYLPTLVDTNNWYLTISNRALKAFIKQIRQQPTWQRNVQMSDDQKNASDHTFMTDEVLMGLKMRGNVTYGMPHVIDRTTNA